MDAGGASDRAKRIIGSQICRALLASAIEIKKKAACEIEGKVKLCLQRDERTAHNAIDIMIQTLEQEFLGVDSSEAGSLVRRSKTSNSHVIGGMLGLVGVVRGYPALCGRILNTLSYVHEASEDVTCLYYSSECIFNIILCAEQNGFDLDFKVLFRVLTKLWLMRGIENADSEKSKLAVGAAAPSALSHAIIWIDRSVRETAERQSIDVRELILNHQSIWPHLHTGWLDILLKNSRENGIMNLRKIVDLYYVLGSQTDKKSADHCTQLGELLAQEIDQNALISDSACNEIVAFWTASPVDKLKVDVLRNISKGLGAHACAFNSMTHFTCFLLSHEEETSDLSLDQESRRFPMTNWLEIFTPNSTIELSDAAWCLITQLITETDLPSYEFMQSLATHLLNKKYSQQLVSNIKNSKWQKDTVRFWRSFAALLTSENIARCVQLISELENPALMLSAVVQVVSAQDSEELPQDVTMFYMSFLLGLKQPACLSSMKFGVDCSAPQKFLSVLRICETRQDSLPLSICITDLKGSEFLEWLEILLYALEWPEAVLYRLGLRFSDFYSMACYALPHSSSMLEVALSRAQFERGGSFVEVQLGSSEQVIMDGGNPRIEILKRLRNINQKPVVVIPPPHHHLEIPVVQSQIELVKKEIGSPKSQLEDAPAPSELKPMINGPSQNIVTETADITQSSPTSEADIDLDQSRSKPSTAATIIDQSVNCVIANENEEPIY